ncbi:hypothetical protein Gasu2_49300 [Galdieria sulphuraria]|uniref:Uncharacterized protein n=1 Tax=Galdieria sulphuraria TaxID=130081 RepID=M2XKM0_GALSU|nr:uncharacterized protein Gasu_19290 [Galdieria sulphuraria]EME30682.1 hypothetical protein Gasu_19290 [Galdieria sulphuraria]GJD10756.1 hypothetical protein Gasu2_49300 [Galdieria sulphuraria]|eukprot:XP_005707202.1 hypothetical protein Gasu_19290 [Galdieria sulphuraria]
MESYSFINTFRCQATWNYQKINQRNKDVSQKPKYPLSILSKASPTLRSLFQLKYRMEERNPVDNVFFPELFNSSLKFCRRCGKAFITSCPGLHSSSAKRKTSMYSINFLSTDIVASARDRHYLMHNRL